MKYLLLTCFLIPLSGLAQDLGNVNSSNSYKELHATQKNIEKDFGDSKNIEITEKIDSSLRVKEATSTIIEMGTKDAQIQALGKTVEADKRKNWIFVLVIILMAGVIYSLLHSRTLFINEKALEVIKRINAELELESKQKELTAKILQLAQKNVVLETIEAEIIPLKSSLHNSENKTYNRLKSLIEHNMADEKEWEQFSTEFSSLNQEYINALVINFGEFSKSEIRLISLLKMNFSSKEIADTLNISDEGVKKARYRLRKKLNLGPEDGLQGFLLSFS